MVGADGKRSRIAAAVGAQKHNQRPSLTCNYYLCVPKTSSGDDFSFGRLNSLFLRQNSLFRRNNSLFCCIGNSAGSV
jgi:hypothetical protein